MPFPAQDALRQALELVGLFPVLQQALSLPPV
jgi:hypothetical protein